MLDFSENDVLQVAKLGYDARRGASGHISNDRSQFLFPFAVQEVEIIFAQVEDETFRYSGDREPSAESIEQEPYFSDLLRETWQKAGWAVFFVKQNTPVEEFESIGIQGLGVIPFEKRYYPGSVREKWLSILRATRNNSYDLFDARSGFDYSSDPQLPDTEFPRFVGHGVYFPDESATARVLEKHIKSAPSMSVFSTSFVPDFAYQDEHFVLVRHPRAEVFSELRYVERLVWDNSAQENILAFRLGVEVKNPGNRSETFSGGILVLPDFGSRNVKVAIDLLTEVFAEFSPHLFDAAHHPWLERYQPVPVANLVTRRQEVWAKAVKDLETLNEQIELEGEKYTWLTGLLVALDDDFTTHVANALRFLELGVVEVDQTLQPKERKREDLRITDPSGYFALGEAKTAGKTRGAAESMISDTEQHQLKYSRDFKTAAPPALLIINYSTGLDPLQRAGRFYQPEVAGRLEAGGITAINSVALFDMCQLVLDGKITRSQARNLLCSGRAMINTLSINDFAAE